MPPYPALGRSDRDGAPGAAAAGAPVATVDPAAEVAVMQALAIARERLGRAQDGLVTIRARGRSLEQRTAWSARAADRYRERLGEWLERVDDAARRIDALEDELRYAQARSASLRGIP